MSLNGQDTYLLAIVSNYDTTFMDAYLHAIVSYYDELFGQLHWFNLAQRQLLQAICDDTSEADLKAHLDATLLNITEGANEEQGDFAKFNWRKPRLGPESPDMLARGRVYEKALGEARPNIQIEKFLVMELEKDASLTDYLSLNLPEVCRLKIACWAATCNLLHMVMALINWRDKVDQKFLYRVLKIAVQFGYVELVERLAELVEEIFGHTVEYEYDFDDICWTGMGSNIRNIDYESGCLYYYAFNDELEPIHLAARLLNVEMVNTLLACQKRRSLWFTHPLHWVAKAGCAEAVNAILVNKENEFRVNETYAIAVSKSEIVADTLSIVGLPYHIAQSMSIVGVPHHIAASRSRIVTRFSCRVDMPFKRWDGKEIGPLCVVNFTPLQLASLHGHRDVVEVLCKDPKRRLRPTIENSQGVTALQIATEMGWDDIVKILTDIPEVQKDLKIFYRDRQVHVDALNAFLVGAALISSVTFAGWLQPPLGYSPFFGSANLDAGASPPSGMYPSFVSVEGHSIMKIFWVFNSLSFFFAIATLMVGATAARPPKNYTYIGVTVRSLRSSLRLAYALLTLSVACVMGAFASAGFVVLPPIHSYTTVMQATVSIGVMVVILAWLLSPVSKVLFKVLTRIQLILVHIYFRPHLYRLHPIWEMIDPIIKILDRIKEKIQMD